MRIRKGLRISRYREGLEVVDIGLTPLNLDNVPDEYKEHLIEVQMKQHEQIGELSKVIAEYDLGLHGEVGEGRVEGDVAHG